MLERGGLTMIGETTNQSGLIQMTAHMLTTAEASRWIIAGALIAALGAFLALCVVTGRKEHKVKYLIIFAAVAVAGIIMLAHGMKLPRVKELKCCASGPVSLEEIAARYDIIEVDGKLLTLREK